MYLRRMFCISILGPHLAKSGKQSQRATSDIVHETPDISDISPAPTDLQLVPNRLQRHV